MIGVFCVFILALLAAAVFSIVYKKHLGAPKTGRTETGADTVRGKGYEEDDSGKPIESRKSIFVKRHLTAGISVDRQHVL